MITVLVKYKKWIESGHVLFDDYCENCSKIVEVEKLTDINNMFSNIVDVKKL